MDQSPAIYSSGPPQDLTGAVLTIDLAAIQENWRRLSRWSAPAECGAAVKGDAYGLGVGPVATALWNAGCRTFFVARPTEGGELRAILPREAIVYILDGLFPGQSEFYAREDLRPALISRDEALEWIAFGTVYGRALPCALHVDTGINRLGLSVEEFEALTREHEVLDRLNLTLVMSHLACADEPPHALNGLQCERFAEVRRTLPKVPASFANSSGIFLGAEFRCDLVRPGIALYGGNPVQPQPNPMLPVVHLAAAVLQLRDVQPGEPVGYGATWTAERPSRIAVIAAGYKDGVSRALGSGADREPAEVCLGGRRCPIVGRISMDMLAIDVTGVPSHLCRRGAKAEIIGPAITIDEVAERAGTISYELLTRLGQRFTRVYAGAGPASAENP